MQKGIHGVGKRVYWLIISICLMTGVFTAQAQKTDPRKITIMNPAGQAPQIPLIPRAARLDTLEGKTIYIVDAKYPLTHQLFTEMQSVLAVKLPKTNWVIKEKAGTYMDDDPKLWAEIKANGHGLIIGVGH
jgi:hypothetical protein